MNNSNLVRETCWPNLLFPALHVFLIRELEHCNIIFKQGQAYWVTIIVSQEGVVGGQAEILPSITSSHNKYSPTN